MLVFLKKLFPGNVLVKLDIFPTFFAFLPGGFVSIENALIYKSSSPKKDSRKFKR